MKNPLILDLEMYIFSQISNIVLKGRKLKFKKKKDKRQKKKIYTDFGKSTGKEKYISGAADFSAARSWLSYPTLFYCNSEAFRICRLMKVKAESQKDKVFVKGRHLSII